jgi:hypothetical protein
MGDFERRYLVKYTGENKTVGTTDKWDELYFYVAKVLSDSSLLF